MNHNLDKRRWGILAASCIMNIFGGSFYAWSVFASPLAERLTALSGHAVTASDLAIVFTVTVILCPFPMIIGGRINDRIGPRWVVFGCGILFALAMILSGHAVSTGMLMVTYGVLIAIASGMVYSCAVGNTVKFFPDRRGLASGLTTAFNGLGAVIVSLAASAMGVTEHVTQVMTALGLICGGTIVICSFFICKCPEGYRPAGYRPEAGPEAHQPTVEKDWHQMLRDKVFYLMLALLLCGAFFGLLTVSQASPIAQNMVGLSAGAAAVAVSVLALCNAVGRVSAGLIADRLGNVNTLTAAYLLSIVGLILLWLTGTGQTVRFYGSLCLIGVCFGAVMGLFPGFTAARFGSRNNSVNYAVMFLGYSLAGLVAPLLMSRIYLSTGSYRPAFLIAIAMALLGIAFTFVYRAQSKKERDAAERN